MISTIEAIIWITLVILAIAVYVRIQRKNGEPVGIAAIKRDVDGTKQAMKLMDDTYGAFVDSMYEKHDEKTSE